MWVRTTKATFALYAAQSRLLRGPRWAITRNDMVKLLSPCVPYAQSLGAVALADDRDSVGQRLAHDRRFDQAHAWALETFENEPARLSEFLCELAMFCATSGDTPEADRYFLEALEKCDPSHPSCHAVLAATLAHSLGQLEGQFPQKVLERLPTGHAPTVALQLDGLRISLPIDVPIPLAQDIVANVVADHFSYAHGDSQSLFDQLESYLESVEADGDRVPSGSMSASLAEITLTVLVLIAQMRKRGKAEAGLQQISRDIEDCLRRFGEPLDAYPAPLASHLTKFISRRYRLRKRPSKQPAVANPPASAATNPPPGALHRLLDHWKSLLR